MSLISYFKSDSFLIISWCLKGQPYKWYYAAYLICLHKFYIYYAYYHFDFAFSEITVVNQALVLVFVIWLYGWNIQFSETYSVLKTKLQMLQIVMDGIHW